MQLGINRDISKYKMTIKGTFTLRSLIVTSILTVVTGFIFFGLYDYLEVNAQLLLIMLIDAPIAAFYPEQIPLYNLPAEKIVRLMLLYLMAPKSSINESIDAYKEQSKGSKMFQRLAKYKYKVPHSIQEFIPLEQFYENGMARTGKRYSMCYLFSDVDSKTLSDDDKISLFTKYEEILSLFSDVTTSYRITVINRNIPSESVYEQMKVPDFPVNIELSNSINDILDKNIQHKNQQYSDLMITISTFQQTEEDAYLKILKLKKMEILEDLERVLDIPPQLVRYITGESNPSEKQKKSSGLIKYANTIIPFESEIPHDTYLYQIINSD